MLSAILCSFVGREIGRRPPRSKELPPSYSTPLTKMRLRMYLPTYLSVNSLSGGTTWTTFLVVRYPRYLAYVRDAGRATAIFGHQDSTTPDARPTSIQRDAKSTPTANRCIARQLLMPRSQRNILQRSSAAVDVDFGLRRRRRRPIVDVRE